MNELFNQCRNQRKNEYRALVKWYWQRKTEIVGAKSDPVPFSTSQIPHRLTWHWTRASAETGQWLTPTPWHGNWEFTKCTQTVICNCARHEGVYGVEVQLHSFLTSALVRKWSASCHGRFTPPWRASGAHWAGAWMCSGTSPGALQKRQISCPGGSRTTIPLVKKPVA
jgi:hypothetical protein